MLVATIGVDPGYVQSRFDPHSVNYLSRVVEIGGSRGYDGLDVLLLCVSSAIKNPGFSGFYPSDPNGHIPVRSSLR